MEQAPAFHLLLTEIKSQETPWLSNIFPLDLFYLWTGARQIVDWSKANILLNISLQRVSDA